MKAKIATVGFGVLLSTAGFGVMGHANAALVNIPAPPAVATGTAVKVGDLLSVGDTGATAGQTSQTAAAAPITLAGKPILGGTAGTTASGKDALIDTGETQLGRITVGAWNTNVSPGQAAGNASVATAKLNGVGDVAVAPSSSLATWNSSQSTASAVSDGAVIHLGDFTVKVLHSQSNSDGRGRTYLVQLLDHEIGVTNSNGCALDIGPLAAVGCLSALSGVSSEADVAQALLGDKVALAKVVSAAASGGKATTANAASSVLSKDISRSTNSLMARTGTQALLLVALGLLFTVAGATAMYGSRKVALAPATLR
jgi:hypothetical protein